MISAPKNCRSTKIAVQTPLTLACARFEHGKAENQLRSFSSDFSGRGMAGDIVDSIRQCQLCHTNKTYPRKLTPQLQLFPGSKPFNPVHTDIFGPLTPTLSWNNDVLVIIDLFTRWAELIAMPDVLVETVVDLFFKSNICRFSVPRVLISKTRLSVRFSINAPAVQAAGNQKFVYHLLSLGWKFAKGKNKSVYCGDTQNILIQTQELSETNSRFDGFFVSNCID
jgi:hypothetical protein